MRKTLAILAGLALVLLFAPVPSAFALLGCNECSTGCANYCGLIQSSTCASYSYSCAADGTGSCFYVCANGSSSSDTCGCSTQPPPSGSPIFKKKTPQDPPQQQSSKKKVPAKDSKSKEKNKSDQTSKK